MSVLRVYDPPECDAAGVPLDWETCRTCKGQGRFPKSYLVPVPDGFSAEGADCSTCAGHGSLKAAALALTSPSHVTLDGVEYRVDPVTTGPNPEAHVALWGGGRRRVVERATLGPVRCEGCGHPMSDGTWEDPDGSDPGPQTDRYEYVAFRAAVRGDLDAGAGGSVPRIHWSACDEGCRHSAPYRNAQPGEADTLGPWQYGGMAPNVGMLLPSDHGLVIEASWRQVDVRTLGWPHDLRPAKLAMLCLRCYAGRRAAEAPSMPPPPPYESGHRYHSHGPA